MVISTGISRVFAFGSLEEKEAITSFFPAFKSVASIVKLRLVEDPASTVPLLGVTVSQDAVSYTHLTLPTICSV